MTQPFVRTEMLLGKANMEKLKACRIALFGVGGVGSYAAEALARTGIGALDLVDHDTVSLSNLNRQLIATLETLGLPKVDVMEARLLSICPDIQIQKRPCFVSEATIGSFDFSLYDYVVDAVDTVTAKIAIIKAAQEADVPLISSMGCGNRLDPSRLYITDIYQTHMDPLAKVMRKRCREANIRELTVLTSAEKPLKPDTALLSEEEPGRKKIPPGSVAFVPSVGGLMIASHVVRSLLL